MEPFKHTCKCNYKLIKHRHKYRPIQVHDTLLLIKTHTVHSHTVRYTDKNSYLSAMKHIKYTQTTV